MFYSEKNKIVETMIRFSTPPPTTLIHPALKQLYFQGIFVTARNAVCRVRVFPTQ